MPVDEHGNVIGQAADINQVEIVGNIQQNQEQVQKPIKKLPEIRARETREPSLVCFKNCTERSVNICWVNYSGNGVLYKILKPGLLYNINTFVTHPWIFRDSLSGARLVINNSEVFMPRHFRESQERDEAGAQRPVRVIYEITIPIFSLRERATQIVLASLNSDETRLAQLQLPRTLVEELQAAAKERADTSSLGANLVALREY